MPIENREEFLKQNRFCVLGTIRKDGRARLSPMAYAYNDGKLFISTTRSRGGAVTARREPRVTVCCVNPASTADYVTVYGRAEVVEDEALSLWLFGAIRGAPLEGDAREAAQKRIRDEGRVVLRITPEEFYPA